MSTARLRFGAFVAPYHNPHENPTWSLQRDLELIRKLDEYGYDEAWIGEHHSGGGEIIASPEVVIAMAGGQTGRIKLGTGVSSLPYHHPFMLADRMVLLDHLTQGRAMLGVGPGALPSDGYMMGIDHGEQRRMMLEGLEAIMALVRSDEPVTMETDWFTLREARLQLKPYTRPCFDVAVASSVSPAGARTAGTLGTGLLSLSATSEATIKVLREQWAIAEDVAGDHGNTMERSDWRLVGPMHIAETRKQAIEDVRFGLAHWVEYRQMIATVPLFDEVLSSVDEMVEKLNSSGLAVIGTVEDAAEQIERLEKHSGGFGTYLFMAHEWANREATLRSFELCSRLLFPEFQDSSRAGVNSRTWVIENRGQFQGEASSARARAAKEHAAERSKRDSVGTAVP